MGTMAEKKPANRQKKSLPAAMEKSKFKKGQSGNPSGRPKLPECLKKNAGRAAEELILLLDSTDEGIRIKAAEKILDRVFGKPAQSLELSGDQDKPVQLQFVDRAVKESPADWLARVAKKK
jgi:hypothetical protein